MQKLKILAVPPNHGGCAFYRVINPMQKLAAMYPDLVEIRFNENPLELDLEAKKYPDFNDENTLKDMRWADVVFLHTICQYGGQYTALAAKVTKDLGKFLHYDTDDLLTDLYTGHRLYDVYKEQKLDDLCKYMYSVADLTTVTQRKFAAKVAQFCGGVLAIVKNSVDYDLPCWKLPNRPTPRKGLTRIGWVGGIHHEEDLKEFTGVPFMTNEKAGRSSIFWNFYGQPAPAKAGDKDEWQNTVWKNYTSMLTKGFKGATNWRVQPAMAPLDYGVFYSDMDIAIAPLQMNEFNDSKSEIKVAECGRYKVPLIASDVGCYNETIRNGETGYLLPHDATKSEWVRILTKCIKNPKHVKEMGENLFKITEEYFDLNKVVKYRLRLYSDSFAMVKERNKGCTYNTEWNIGE